LWADTFDRKLIDIFSVETEVAKTIAEKLQAKLTGREAQVITAQPTTNSAAHDAYLRGLADRLKPSFTTAATATEAQKNLREAVRLDPEFAVAWALLAEVDAIGYLTTNLDPTLALQEEARHAAETAYTLQPNLGEALLAQGYYYYACLKDYDHAVSYFAKARQLLPNSSQIPEALAYVARRRGQWAQSESYFGDVESLDPRNVYALGQDGLSKLMQRRFPDALRKFQQVLEITPNDTDTITNLALVAQARDDLPRAAALLAPLRPIAADSLLRTQLYQGILERHPEAAIPQLQEMLARPDSTQAAANAELRYLLGWAQELEADHAAAQETWRQARRELEALLPLQPDNYRLLGNLALTQLALGDKAQALSLAERGLKVKPLQTDAVHGGIPIEYLARVAAQAGEPDRALASLEKLLSIPGEGIFNLPLTPALLRLDPMFDPLRSDPRFQKLAEGKP
ncbi:MAG: tetratricopeptide repeat protein, partial [Spartobacteria bacterium]